MGGVSNKRDAYGKREQRREKGRKEEGEGEDEKVLYGPSSGKVKVKR